MRISDQHSSNVLSLPLGHANYDLEELRPLRIANVAYLNSIPYRALAELPWIQYQELTPTECAQKLHEGEIDLGLVPITEVLEVGGYQLLNYGIVADGPVGIGYLLSERPLEQLNHILLDSTSRTTTILIKALIHEFYPTLSDRMTYERIAPEEIPSRIGGATGGVIIGDAGHRLRLRFGYSLDLSGHWRERTGLPFLFAAWVAHPSLVDAKMVYQLERAFQLGLRHREIYAREWPDELHIDRNSASEYVSTAVKYEIDEDALSGAKKFASIVSSFQLLPEQSLQVFTQTPFSFLVNDPPDLSTKRSDTDVLTLLHRAARGCRFSIEETLFATEHLNLVDLALAARSCVDRTNFRGETGDIPRLEIQHSDTCWIRSRFSPSYLPPGHRLSMILTGSELERQMKGLQPGSSVVLSLTSGISPELHLDYFIELLSKVRGELFRIGVSGRIIALSADEIALLSQLERTPVAEILSKLRRAGLDILGGGSPLLLVDRIRRRYGLKLIDSNTWLSIHTSAHHLGIRSECSLPINPGDAWRDRLIHLHKLRQLQDDTAGFEGLQLECLGILPPNFSRRESPARTLMLGIALARIFLDNIPKITVSAQGIGTPMAEAAVHFGANDSGVALV